MASVDRAARRCRISRRVRIFLLAALASPATLFAQTVSIPAGASWRVGDGAIDLDCAAVAVDGTLDAGDGRLDGVGALDVGGQLAAGTGRIEIGGDWNNHGSFLAGTGTVQLGDRCGAAGSTIRGANAFSNLRIESARSKAYAFDATALQTVAQSLRIVGAPGQYLSVRSTQAGMRARLALASGGAQQIAWVDVADMEAPANAAWLAQGAPAAFDAIDSGNNFRWFLWSGLPTVSIPIPAASGWALLLLASALIALGWRRVRLR